MTDDITLAPDVEVKEATAMPEPVEEKIQDIRLELNTLESNSAETYTSKINGKLLAVIAQSDKPVHLLIETESGLNIYEKIDFYGHYYLLIKITAVSKSGNQFNFVASSFYLNDVLKVTLKGQRYSQINVTVRYCDG
jgi:hypothetical protein